MGFNLPVIVTDVLKDTSHTRDEYKTKHKPEIEAKKHAALREP